MRPPDDCQINEHTGQSEPTVQFLREELRVAQAEKERVPDVCARDTSGCEAAIPSTSRSAKLSHLVLVKRAP